MFGFLKKKPHALSFFQKNHPVDGPYEDEIIFGKNQNGTMRAEIDWMVDIACMAAGLATIQRAMTNNKGGNPRDVIELGYVFGLLDWHKNNVWGVREFNRSFFHFGYFHYFDNALSPNRKKALDRANIALSVTGICIENGDKEFLESASKGIKDARNLDDSRAGPGRHIPRELYDYLSQQ